MPVRPVYIITWSLIVDCIKPMTVLFLVGTRRRRGVNLVIYIFFFRMNYSLLLNFHMYVWFMIDCNTAAEAPLLVYT
jgi:hypothetical protein